MTPSASDVRATDGYGPPAGPSLTLVRESLADPESTATTDPILGSDLDPDPRGATTAVRPERLLERARNRRRLPGAHLVTRSLVRSLLGRMTSGTLTVIDQDGRHRFGPGGGLEAEIEVHDDRAWTALATEGSIGLGRGYLEGWWHSDDPVAVVRIIIANIEPVDEIRNRIHDAVGWVTDPIRSKLPRRNRHHNKEDIASHYDVGNDFFELFLDETLTYSSAVFTDPGMPLADASRAKYDRLIAKLGLTHSHRLLEIGTGWGGLALRASDTVGCEITTTTISEEQLAEARNRISAAGHADRVTVLDSDWRDLEGTYDRIVSIEMIEAVDWRDYDRFFTTIESCLAPDGLVGIQAICIPDRRYERTKNTEDYIRRFVFPGGFLPSIGSITASVSGSTRLQVLDVEDFTAHYAETLRRWREDFDAHLPEVRDLGLDERFIRLWRFYLAYCEAGFLERHCTVNQFVLAGREWRPDGLALRPL